jgi:hypothetical protein
MGPPGDEQRFIRTCETILRRYPEITTYEFWNEPFQYYVTTALAGAYMGNDQWNIGYGPDRTCNNTAFAVMTDFLEDRVPLVDI